MIKEFQGEYRFLSNFWPCKVTLDGREYPTTENAYQAAKSVLKDERKQFEAITAGQAKRAGRKLTVREDWGTVKRDVMLQLNRQKYAVEPLRSQLIATGNNEIQEGNTWGDTFWGVCKGKGENHLGRILMQIRCEIKDETSL